MAFLACKEPESAPLPEPSAEPEAPQDTPPAAPLSSSLSPEAPAPMEKGSRERKGRKSETRQMEKTLAARLTPAEYASVTEKAARAGLSNSAYTRACLLGRPGPRAKRAPPIHGPLLAQAITALNRVGNNINQIAHHLNAGGHPDSKQIAEARAELSACIKAFLKALGRRP